MVLHNQARRLVYKVFNNVKREADTGIPVHDVARRKNALEKRAMYLLDVRKELSAKATS
jgi:hypothetical protein